ncbi:YtxH domain-containing protein [Geomonas sp. RF6]|uniref:YtxH domain-containing protein n=1 Tax=Geomonas sp. RF6 TaxID=2897342 RepID=UPI001E449CC2|nr:YtxH domain-containing protein [Geomonas sp. RF6]UFS71232.1 YtxH domain-containing protein [Geomonas sp. RF6]
MSKKKQTETAALVAFLAGAAVAAGAALLFTPKSGKEVREKLGEATDGAIEKLKLCVAGASYKVKGTANGDSLDYDGGDAWI